MEQGQIVAPRLGLDWSQLSRTEQWGIAWQYGPKALWEIITLIRPLSFFLSLLSVGATVLLGAWRWHILLEAQGTVMVSGREEADIVLTMGKSGQKNGLSLVDHNFFLES